MSTLIVFSSKYGYTESCVNILSKEIKDEVTVINLKNTQNINLSKYNKIIIGGPIYMGKIQKEVKEFCLNNLEELKNKKIGLFICEMQKEKIINNQILENFPPELINIALITSHFGGELYYDKMNFFDKIIAKLFEKYLSNKSYILKDNIIHFAKAMNSV